MIRFLLLTFLLLTGSFLPGLAQVNNPFPDTQDRMLGKASMFAVLSANNITNTGATIVIGNLGTGTGDLVDNGELSATEKEIQKTNAKEALSDATAAYADLSGRTPAPGQTYTRFPNSFGPGVHVINGNANLNEALNGSIEFDGKGDPNAKFIVVIKGNMTYTLPPGGITSLRVVTTGGAEAKNIYWVVEGSVSLAGISLFQGNIIAQRDITLKQRVYLTGRAISLNGSISLNGNLVFLPSVILTDLNINKVAEEGEYAVGANIRYTITVTNAGPGTAENVIVQENFPRTGLEFISAEPGKGEFKKDADGKYRWYVGNLENDEVAVLTVTFKLLVNGTVDNQVIIEPNPNNPDPNPDDNTDTDPVPVTCKDPSLTISGETDLCAVPDEVVYTVTEVVGGRYTFTLSPNLERIGAADETSNVIRVKVNGPGTISLAVEDQCGSVYSAEKEVTINAIPVAPTIEGDFEVCTGSQTYTATGVPEGATLLWSATPGVTIEGPNNQQTVTVNVSSGGGTLSVVATSKCGAQGFTQQQTISVASAPAAPAGLTGGNDVVCLGDEIEFTADEVTDAASYKWSFPADWAVVTGTPEDERTIKLKVGLSSGDVSVRALNECSVEGSPFTKQITVNTKPAKPTITGVNAVCVDKGETYSVGAVDGATYTWTEPAGWVIEGERNSSTITLKPTGNAEAGILKVVITNACGDSEPGEINLTPLQDPAVPVVGGPRGVCVNNEITYRVSNPEDGVTYTWTVTEGLAIAGSHQGASVTVNAGTTGGTVTVEASNACNTVSETFRISINQAPDAPANIEGPSQVCTGGEFTYTAAEVRNVSYIWELPEGWQVAPGSATNQREIRVIIGSTGGTLKVYTRYECINSEQPTTLDVTVLPPAAILGQIKDNSNVCDGLVYSVDPVQGISSYTWSAPNGFTIVSGQGSNTIKVKADSPTSKGSVTVIAVDGSCKSQPVSATMDASLADGNLNFPKAFSPNGDRINDTWEIKNLEKFPNNEVTIFNRWGSEVYKKKGYQNDWAGKGLEQGTYFYKVRVTLCDGVVKEFTGYTTLFR